MKTFKFFGLSLALFLCLPGVWAQVQLTGTIIDAQTQEAIDEAKVQVLLKTGKGNSAITNETGQYTVSLDEGATRVMIQRTGYASLMPKVADLEDGNFQLKPKTGINKTLTASNAGALVSVARGSQAVSVSGGGLGASFLRFVFDHENYTYYVKNLSRPEWPVYSGEFEKMNDDRELFSSDLYYHATEEGSHHYSVELQDKFVATNFPFHDDSTQRTGLFSGVNTQVDNSANFHLFDGVYMGFLLDMPTGEFSHEDGMLWGLAIFTRPEADDPNAGQAGVILMNLYDTNYITPDEIDWEEELDLLIQSIEEGYSDLNEDVEDVLIGSYRVDPEANESFDVQFVSMDDVLDAENEEEIEESSEYFAASGFADSQSAVMTIDVPDQGILQFVKITDLEGNDTDQDGPGGDYLYIQSDADYGGGAGVFEIDGESETMDIYLFPDQYASEKDVETQEDISISQSSIKNLYFTDGYEHDELGEFDERLYLLISNDFMMHFTIDTESGGLLNYGIGALDE